MTRNRNVRNTTKFKRSIKAISPVIATLLMIAIAVVASLVVYAWVTGYIGGATNKAGNAIQIQSFAPKDGNLVVYVQNVGQGVVQLKPGTSLYVNGDLVPIIGDGPITIAEGQTVELDTNYEYSGEKVSLKITTTGGTFTQTLGMSTAGSGGGLILPKYTLTVNPSTQGSVARSPDQAQYTSGTSVMLTATATVDGYTFQSWSGDVPTADVNSNPVTIKMDSNKDVTPTFVQTPYSLDARTTGNGRGTITPDPVAPYTFGQTVRLTAETDISSTFGGWTGDGTVDSQNPLVYIVRLNGDKTATASFIIKTFTITPQTVTNGQITPNTAQTVNYGTDSEPFTVAASTAGNGYRIINVFDGTTTIPGGAGLTTFQYTFQNVIANHQISATFEPIPSSHIVHFDMGTGGQLIDPTEGDHTYTDGQEVQLGATAASTYHFDHWEASVTTITFDTATIQNAKATISSAGTITAVFHKNTAIPTDPLRPNGVGYFNELDYTPQSSHAAWQVVRDTSTTHYVFEDSETDHYHTDTFVMDDMPSGEINSVTVYVMLAKTTTDTPVPGNPNALIRLRLGTTDLDSTTPISISSTTFTQYSQTFANKPGGTGWTYTDINNLQAGIRLEAARVEHDPPGPGGNHWHYSEALCSEIWIVVNYTPT